MKILLLCILFFNVVAIFAQTSTFSADPGQWVAPANWDNGVPDSLTDAIINGRCRTALGGGDCKNLYLKAGRRLRLVDGYAVIVHGICDLTSTSIVEFDGGYLTLNDTIMLNGIPRMQIGGTVTFQSGFNIGQ